MRDFITSCQELPVSPHITRKESFGGSAVLAKLAPSAGYQVSQRKRVEEILGWTKTVAGGRKLRYKGVERNRLWAEMTAAAYNLVRMSKLVAVPA